MTVVASCEDPGLSVQLVPLYSTVCCAVAQVLLLVVALASRIVVLLHKSFWV